MSAENYLLKKLTVRIFFSLSFYQKNFRCRKNSHNVLSREMSANAKSQNKYYHWREGVRGRRATKYNKRRRFRNLRWRPFFWIFCSALLPTFSIHPSTLVIMCMTLVWCENDVKIILLIFCICGTIVVGIVIARQCRQKQKMKRNEIIEQNEMKMELDNINYGTHLSGHILK